MQIKYRPGTNKDPKCFSNICLPKLGYRFESSFEWRHIYIKDNCPENWYISSDHYSRKDNDMSHISETA